MVALAAAQGQDKYRVYFGTYTGEQSKGIYQCELNLKDGSLSAATLAARLAARPLSAFHQTRSSCTRSMKGCRGQRVFDRRKSGKLTFLNSQPSQGDAPCHLVVDPTGKNVLAANYSGGSCICIPIDADGKLAKASSFQQHVGPRKNGAFDPRRQGQQFGAVLVTWGSTR